MSKIQFSREYEKMKRFVYNCDETATPEMLDDLPRSIEHAMGLAKRYMEYASRCEAMLSLTRGAR